MTSAQYAHDSVLRDAEERRRVASIESERDDLKVENARLRARIEELAVEYREKNAHLWRERNALLEAAKDVLVCDKALSDARAWNEGHIEERMVAELRMVQSFAPLRLAVDACSSTARGDKR